MASITLDLAGVEVEQAIRRATGTMLIEVAAAADEAAAALDLQGNKAGQHAMERFSEGLRRRAQQEAQQASDLYRESA